MLRASLTGSLPGAGVMLPDPWPDLGEFKFTILLPANPFRSDVSVYLELNMLKISGDLTVNISNSCFQPMIFAAQGLKCQRWNNILSVSFWSQGNMTSKILKHQLCSHFMAKILELPMCLQDYQKRQ
jgi:hypothetical protein